jgi:hypothetical protein
MENRTITVRLDNTNFKKLKEFSVMNYISASEIFRVLIEKSKIKLDNARDRYTVSNNAIKNKESTNKNNVILYLNKELINKLVDMKLENNISYSEIARCLIRDADFSKMKFRTIDELNRNKRPKDKEKFNIYLRLDVPTHKRLKEFSLKNYVAFSEIARVLIENSDVKINVKDMGTVIRDGSQKGKTHKNIIVVYLNKELYEKLNKMKIENHASHSEIIRYLFENADFSKMKFKTKDKTYSASRQKVLKRKSEAKK